MALAGKLEKVIETKAPAEKFHEVFSCKPHHLPNVSPEKIQGFQMHEGSCGAAGSVINWNYVLGEWKLNTLTIILTFTNFSITCMQEVRKEFEEKKRRLNLWSISLWLGFLFQRSILCSKLGPCPIDFRCDVQISKYGIKFYAFSHNFDA